MNQTSSQNNDKLKEKSSSTSKLDEKTANKNLDRLSSALKANIARRKRATINSNGE